MCGIVTVLKFDRSGEVDPATLKAMTEVMRHRGPDEEGFHILGSVGLGFRRLSIIDLAGGHQPMSNEDGSVWIVFNGEVYNFGPLRDELEKRGHKFRTRSDTESVLHAYEEWKEECLQKLNGMFAFAIWDERNRTLFAARDRLGIKPLNYYVDDRMLILCSELKSLLRHPRADLRVDYDAIDQYFTYGAIPAPRTIYRKARKLPPAHYLRWHDGRLCVQRYWQVNPSDRPFLSEDDYLDALDELLTDSVKIRLISDVPLGAFLSGGIDSSMIVAMMSKVSRQPVKTFCVGFEQQTFDERDHARMVAEKFGADHTEYVAKYNIAEDVPRIMANFDEPFFDSSAIPTYHVSRMARQEVTVCLSGDGGDELFAGYDHYVRALRNDRIASMMPGWLRKVLRRTSRALPFGFKGKNTLHAHTLLGPELFVQGTVRQSFDLLRESLYSESLKEAVNASERYAVVRDFFRRYEGEDVLTRIILTDLQTYLPNDILTKVDRTSMLNSLEARVPFLDHRLVELVAGIPSGLKYSNGVRKYILRKLAARYLPTEVINRPKKGFSVPLHRWLTRDLREMALDMLTSRRFRERGLFEGRIVKRFLKSTFEGRGRYYRMVWLLFCLELWFRTMESEVRS
ncbi:asparagine synthase (glutamine-hydrolyzing) [bacterium]|nr:asparagine synthase (glutamine-hydrolyzing) [bacterium]